ncbi:MAG: hypothetical protein LBF65_00455 [Holosporales bacterium]|jgi:hypothetical protein|nr:hypothetical protein [Holosporales bacterium]
MKYNISQMQKKIMLLKTNDAASETTTQRFIDILKTKASITPLSGKTQGRDQALYEVIVPKPPPSCANVAFSGIRWNDEEYSCESTFRPFQHDFLKGVVRKTNC